MKNQATKASLSPLRRRLLEKMQDVNFGRILNIEIQNGEPAFTPLTRVERQIRFGGENHPRPETRLDDFPLKAGIVELFETIERMGSGMIQKLEIKGGLPLGMTIDEPAVMLGSEQAL